MPDVKIRLSDADYDRLTRDAEGRLPLATHARVIILDHLDRAARESAEQVTVR